MFQKYYKNSIIVTGVTGLLRAYSLPRNTIKALCHLCFSHLVTPVTGFRTRARVRNFSNSSYLLYLSKQNLFSRVSHLPRNTRNTRNNTCFYYIFYFFTCNKSKFCRNKVAFTRNNRLKNQQGY